MEIHYSVSFRATGRGSKTANREAMADLDNLTSAIEEAVQNWAYEHEGEHDDPEWEIEVKELGAELTC